MVDDLLKASAAARYLGVTRQRIYELAASGRIGQRVAGYWVFSSRELEQYRKQRGQNLGGRPRHKHGQSGVQATRPQQAVPLESGKRLIIEQYIEAALRYATVQPLPSGGYVGASLDFPELNAFATTRAECTDRLQSDMERLVRESLRYGRALPSIDGLMPTSTDL